MLAIGIEPEMEVTMDYEKTAAELLQIRAEFARIPRHRLIDEFARGEFFVLNYLLESRGKAHPKELSRQMNVSTARIAALINQTDRKGWTVRTADNEDSRRTLVTITEEGKAAVTGRKKEIFNMVVEMLQELGEEDADRLLKIKKRILANSKAGGEDIE